MSRSNAAGVPLDSREGFPLTLTQVKDIVKNLEEIAKGHHTELWYRELLRSPSADLQVIRYILDNVDWNVSGRPHIAPQNHLYQYLAKQEAIQYPELSLDMPLINSLIDQKDRGALPVQVEQLIERLDLQAHSLELDLRNNEPRSVIFKQQSKIQKTLDAIEALLNPPEISITTVTPTTTQGERYTCQVCETEDFSWLLPEARVDVEVMSDNPAIAKLQHQLRHLVIEYKNTRNRILKMDLEDQMAEIHSKIEQLRG